MSEPDDEVVIERGRCRTCRANYVLRYQGECRNCIADAAPIDDEPPICATIRNMEERR